MALSEVHPNLTLPQAELRAFCRRYHVQRLALFGSVLRADFSPESDIDVLVQFQPATRVGFLTLAKMQNELADLFGRPVDLIPMQGLKAVIRDEVLSSSVEVYAA